MTRFYLSIELCNLIKSYNLFVISNNKFKGTSGKVYDLLPEEDDYEEKIAPIQSEKTDVTSQDPISTKSSSKKKKKKKSSESKKKKKRKRHLSTSSSNVSLIFK